MPEYKVSSEQLQATAGNINASSERIMDELNRVIGQVQATQGFWSGQAQGTYNDLMQRWTKSAEQVRENLNETVRALNQAASDYAQTEQLQTQRFNR